MVFSSNIFLYLFLPLFLGGYYATPARFRNVIILIGSYLFYAWWRIDFTFLFAGVTLWNYLIFKAMTRKNAPEKHWLALGIIGNLCVLGIFKYLDFGVESLNLLLTQAGFQSIATTHIILPIGISFYIFQAMSFLIDISRKDAPHPKNFWDFAAFISLFPQLIAGPILRYKDLATQFQNRTHSIDKFSEGAYRFMIGFIQKIFIADSVAPLADLMFGLNDQSFMTAWLGALAYTIQLYFDFIGYSSMAIGLGLMMGFRFMENFNHPYLSRSITEFWQRWHISLSSWLKDYLYIPLGGNRRGKIRTTINLFLTMVLGGIWHGANWTFLLWGAWHGILLGIERAFGIKKNLQTRPAYRSILTFFLVVLGWVLFRAETLEQADAFYNAMAGLNGFAIADSVDWQITRASLWALGIGFGLLYIHPKWLEFRSKITGSPAMRTTGYQNPWVGGATFLLFILAATKLAASSYSPFLYFQF